jgi:hypothetical protein
LTSAAPLFAATALSLVLAPKSAHATTNTWDLVANMSDEFNSSNSQPDTTKWSIQNYQGGGGNAEIEYYTNDSNHVYLTDNNSLTGSTNRWLVLKTELASCGSSGWCSGEILGKNTITANQSFAVEWRGKPNTSHDDSTAQCNSSQPYCGVEVSDWSGFQSAAWLLNSGCTSNPAATGAPSACNGPLVTVMDLLMNQPTDYSNGITRWFNSMPSPMNGQSGNAHVNAAVDWSSSSQDSQTYCAEVSGCGYGSSISQHFGGDGSTNSEFHVYRVEVTVNTAVSPAVADKIYYMVDGRVYSVHPNNMSTSQAFDVIINTAVGGNLVANSNPSAQTQYNLIDYIRTYQLGPIGGLSSGGVSNNAYIVRNQLSGMTLDNGTTSTNDCGSGGPTVCQTSFFNTSTRRWNLAFQSTDGNGVDWYELQNNGNCLQENAGNTLSLVACTGASAQLFALPDVPNSYGNAYFSGFTEILNQSYSNCLQNALSTAEQAAVTPSACNDDPSMKWNVSQSE